MARVAVIVKFFPDSPEVSLNDLLEEIKSSLPEGFEIVGSGEEPIAFGLKALKVIIAIPEETEGGTEKLEGILRGVDRVQEVEIEGVTRIS